MFTETAASLRAASACGDVDVARSAQERRDFALWRLDPEADVLVRRNAKAPTPVSPRDATVVHLPLAGMTPNPFRAGAVVEAAAGDTTQVVFPSEEAQTVRVIDDLMLVANDFHKPLSEQTRSAPTAYASPMAGEVFVAFYKPGNRNAFVWRIDADGCAARRCSRGQAAFAALQKPGQIFPAALAQRRVACGSWLLCTSATPSRTNSPPVPQARPCSGRAPGHAQSIGL